MPNDELLTCQHCEGSGTCRANSPQSCDECISAAKERVEADSLGLVSCSKCHGIGQRDRSTELFYESSAVRDKAMSQYPPITHVHTQEENETQRKADSRRFIVAMTVVIGGFALVSSGIIVDIVGSNRSILSITLPVASALISGAVGSFVGYWGRPDQQASHTEDQAQ